MIELNMPYLLADNIFVPIEALCEYPENKHYTFLCYSIEAGKTEARYKMCGQPFLLSEEEIKKAFPLEIKCADCLFRITAKNFDNNLYQKNYCNQTDSMMHIGILPFSPACQMFRPSSEPYVKQDYNATAQLIDSIFQDVEVEEYCIRSEKREVTELCGHLGGMLSEDIFDETFCFSDKNILAVKDYIPHFIPAFNNIWKPSAFTIKRSDFNYHFYLHEFSNSEYNAFIFRESNIVIVCHYEYVYKMKYL